MDAKCCKCNLYWNISIKAQVPMNGYICPKCRAKETKEKQKAKELRKGRITSVLLKNRKRFHT
ncbi:hypothetical protein FDC58_04885 [Clostridium botulinum]|uniref:hypothetical protein n=1 Tax=Clostridium cagae TaxID=2080751 RepID=UPI000CF6BB85|nr:hypothetical protein [Clostridium cagae]NFO86125.1 hypothetical protein [Clostridium botulinum]NFP28628.1 hypothetical protein [Clostridium botulinum]